MPKSKHISNCYYNHPGMELFSNDFVTSLERYGLRTKRTIKF